MVKQPSESEKCVATTRTGARCGRWPISGATVCRAHGGASPHVKQAAARRVVIAKARAKAKAIAERNRSELEVPPIEDPFEALMLCASKAMWLTQILEDEVRALTEIRYRTDSEQTRAELAAYMHMLGQTASILGGINKLALDERLVRVKETQAAKVALAVTMALRAAGLEGMPLEKARREVARLLVGGKTLRDLSLPSAMENVARKELG